MWFLFHCILQQVVSGRAIRSQERIDLILLKKEKMNLILSNPISTPHKLVSCCVNFSRGFPLKSRKRGAKTKISPRVLHTLLLLGDRKIGVICRIEVLFFLHWRAKKRKRPSSKFQHCNRHPMNRRSIQNYKPSSDIIQGVTFSFSSVTCQ